MLPMPCYKSESKMNNNIYCLQDNAQLVLIQVETLQFEFSFFHSVRNTHRESCYLSFRTPSSSVEPATHSSLMLAQLVE